MIKFTIDNRQVEVEAGATILNGARKAGIEIPTMCFMKGVDPSTSCMVCVVKVNGSDNFLPACGTVAVEGMVVENNCDDIIETRRMAIELLLSDHLGDCVGPCEVGCPAGMNIPLMIRQIRQGKLEEAIATVKKDIALPAVLGRICPGPCEKVCRRVSYDSAISICLLKRYVADVDLQSDRPYSPACKPKNSKRVAVVGAGPCSLAAAYYLLQGGYDCTIFDEHEKMGGRLRYGSGELVDSAVLDAEIAVIEKMGLDFRDSVQVGKDVSIEELGRDFDAILLATGKIEAGRNAWALVEQNEKGIVVDRATYQTSQGGIFAGGGAIGRGDLVIRAVADGKEIAASIDEYLSGGDGADKPAEFNCRIGKLAEGEIEEFLSASVSKSGREEPADTKGGLTNEQATGEAARCLHCDCRGADDCKLREHAGTYAAKSRRYASQRRGFVQQRSSKGVVFEEGKCIDCGLCIVIAKAGGEEFGFTFIGRGFNVRVAVPFGRNLDEGLRKTAQKCVEACPTGALAFE